MASAPPLRACIANVTGDKGTQIHGAGHCATLQTNVTLCVFDVLWLDGIDCTQLPYRDRRRVLEMVEVSGPAWCTVPRFPFNDADCGPPADV